MDLKENCINLVTDLINKLELLNEKILDYENENNHNYIKYIKQKEKADKLENDNEFLRNQLMYFLKQDLDNEN